MDCFYDRTALLLGGELPILRRSHVLILGVGGVGSFAAEFLCRAGVAELTLIDADCVESSNRNRQLPALCSTMGRAKVDVMKERLLDINPECRIHAMPVYFDESNGDAILNFPFDTAADAIDTLSSKAFFLSGCLARKKPVVSSMGSGGRVDPSKIHFSTLDKTFNCGLARALRHRLQAQHVPLNKIRCVFSEECVPQTAVRPEETGCAKRSVTGTISYLPAVFGAYIAAQTVRLLTGATPLR